ncbi:MAG: universal stress protein [Blastocatellia bacterium]|nr:universal stress protein [Blastocatellia bacterium]
MRVLLTTDGSEQSTAALYTTASLLKKEGVQYDLLCVAPEYIPPKAKLEKDTKKRERMIKAYREQIRIKAQEMLVYAQASLTTRGINAGTKTELGSPARLIVQMSARYDITVVGAHDRYTRGKSGLGPVASHVVASAPNDVLVGRELAGDRSWRVLAAVDGSLAAERALNLFADRFQAESAEITLMHVEETPWIHLGLGREWFDYSEEMLDKTGSETGEAFEGELNYEARDVIEESRSMLESRGLSASTIISEGDPALEIISEAEQGDYDLIVMGATGVSDLKHSMLGSVSAKVARDAPCSVFVAKFIE